MINMIMTNILYEKDRFAPHPIDSQMILFENGQNGHFTILIPVTCVLVHNKMLIHIPRNNFVLVKKKKEKGCNNIL